MRPQQHWDWRAATNFILGGTGAGLLVFAPLTGNFLHVILGLVLIAAGLGAVWLEIGRKLRALHVLFNPFTSWMTREAFSALLVFGLGIAFLLYGNRSLVYFVSGTAAIFLYCQARILFAAKGIPAWRVPQVVPLVVSTGLAEGAALAVAFGAPSVVLLVLVLARYWAWRRYAARVARKDLALQGTAMAALLAAAAWFVPPLGLAAAAVVLAGGGWLKFVLVTRASYKQEFTLPHLPVRGTR